MDQDIRKTIQLKVKQADVRSLLKLSSKLPAGRRESFPNIYGNLLNLLETKVQAEALTALAQFYDPPLRCFTFQDYQLAPTLEEFERILRFPAENKKPYRYEEHYPLANEVLAEILKVGMPNLAKEVVKREEVEGLPRGYLEKEASSLAEKSEWSAFTDVLALLIYGVILFPHVDDLIDYAAIDVFLAFKTRGQDPTSVILADVYYALHERHRKKGGVVLCCLPVLYHWFISHAFKRNSLIEAKSKKEWAQYITGLKGSDISWYSYTQDIAEVVCQCGDFPNVPLIGTKGCINYNPTLAMRQLGYPMMGPPSDESLTPFVLHDRGAEDLNMLRRVSRAWDRILRKGRELGRRSIHVEESYLQWVRLRVQEVKLPFRLALPDEPKGPEPVVIPNEEVEKLNDALSKSEQEKANLRAQLETMLQENRSLQQKNTAKEKRIAEYAERISAGNEKLRRVQEGLKSANDELKVRNRDRDRAIDKAYVWEAQLKKSVAAEESLRGQLEKMKFQIEGVVAEYEAKIAVERKARDVVRERLDECQRALQKELRDANELKVFAEYEEKICEEIKKENAYLKEEYMKLNDHCYYLKERFSRLAALCNDAIREVPRRLDLAAIGMNKDNTPPAVYKFVTFLMCLVPMLRRRAGIPEDRKRKRT